MGTKNEEAVTWSEKAEANSDNFPGGGRIAGSTSKNAGNQQERNTRACGSQSGIFALGTADDGGILDHLIGECVDQMATKREEAKRLDAEIKRLESRVEEYRTLREQLKKQSEEIDE
nr:hypothetical protein [Hassalia byssoidea]